MDAGQADSLNSLTPADSQRRAVLDLLADPGVLRERPPRPIAGVNLAACTALGYARDELLGMPLGRFCRPRTWPAWSESLPPPREGNRPCCFASNNVATTAPPCRANGTYRDLPSHGASRGSLSPGMLATAVRAEASAEASAASADLDAGAAIR